MDAEKAAWFVDLFVMTACSSDLLVSGATASAVKTVLADALAAGLTAQDDVIVVVFAACHVVVIVSFDFSGVVLVVQSAAVHLKVAVVFFLRAVVVKGVFGVAAVPKAFHTDVVLVVETLLLLAVQVAVALHVLAAVVLHVDFACLGVVPDYCYSAVTAEFYALAGKANLAAVAPKLVSLAALAG